ncbi:ABC transporter permease, partial [Candidatus Bathyarchaeota archaeon]|nr:ABC transporter permease [Candidatus Bathyarchaeota archaeon]
SNIAGFAIGIAALVTLVMAARGWEACTSGPLRTIGADMVFIYSAPISATPGTGCYLAMHLFTYPFSTSIVNDLAKVPGVERVTPILLHRMRAITFCGIDPSETKTNAILPEDVIEGRYLNPDDRGVALVDSKYALQCELKVGSIVTYVKNFTVVGIVQAKAMSIIQSAIYVNLPDAQETVDAKEKVNIALIRVQDPRKVKTISEAIMRLWPGSTVITASDIASVTTGILNIGEQTAWNISIALAAVAILFGFKSQLSALVERTREIGLLKAVGWSKQDIMRLIIIESLIQGLIGGLLGSAIDYGASIYVPSSIGGEFGGALQFVNVDPILLAIGVSIA